MLHNEDSDHANCTNKAFNIVCNAPAEFWSNHNKNRPTPITRPNTPSPLVANSTDIKTPSPNDCYSDIEQHLQLPRPLNNKQAFKVGGVRKNIKRSVKLPKNDTTNLFNITTNKKWAATCKNFDQAHIKDDNITVGKLGLYDIRIGFININGFKDDKIEYMLWYYDACDLDILFINDLRLTELEVDIKKQKIHARLGDKYGNFSTISKTNLNRNCSVGGQMVIVNPT